MGNLANKSSASNQTEPLDVVHDRVKAHIREQKDETAGSQAVRVVSIQQLERKIQPEGYDYDKISKIRALRSAGKIKDVSYFEETGQEGTKRVVHQNNFIGTFLTAYNYHGDVLLSPDEIWIMICLFFSKYVDANAEKLRNKFVSHEGKKDLVVEEGPGSQETNWDNFFEQILDLVEKNTISGTVETMACNFTTTTRIHKVISTAIIMNSFKKYFNYGRMILGCGIANVKFTGTRNDWLLLIAQAKNLYQYDVDGRLDKYLKHVLVILNQFLDTYDNKVDVGFWNRILATEVHRIGSGSQTQTNIDGWILHFFGIYQKVDLDDVPDYTISVPIKLVNLDAGYEKKLELCANFISTSKYDEYTYKPDLGICIINAKKESEDQDGYNFRM
jgi:hypothetical protein